MLNKYHSQQQGARAWSADSRLAQGCQPCLHHFHMSLTKRVRDGAVESAVESTCVSSGIRCMYWDLRGLRFEGHPPTESDSN